jgi:hypothetical protein
MNQPVKNLIEDSTRYFAILLADSTISRNLRELTAEEIAELLANHAAATAIAHGLEDDHDITPYVHAGLISYLTSLVANAALDEPAEEASEEEADA